MIYPHSTRLPGTEQGLRFTWALSSDHHLARQNVVGAGKQVLKYFFQGGLSLTVAQSSLCWMPLTSQVSNHKALKGHRHSLLTTAPDFQVNKQKCGCQLMTVPPMSCNHTENFTHISLFRLGLFGNLALI